MAFRSSAAVERTVRTSRRPVSFDADGVISLAAGEPDFPTPQPIVDSVVEAFQSGPIRYGDFTGDPELRRAIARRVSRLRGRDCRENEVLVTHGSTAGLASTIFATVDGGDRVVILEPTYSLYADLVQLVGGICVPVPTRKDHHLDLEALKKAVPGARLVVICNPCNPTGAVFSRAELEGLGELITSSETLIVADEVYEQLVYDGANFTSCLAIPALAERLIYVQSLSKTYAMTGWRLGYTIARSEILSAVAQVHRTFNGPVNAAVQRAALQALNDDGALIRPMLEAYARRRALLLRLLEEIPGLEVRAPAGTYYIFAKYAYPMKSVALVARLRDGGVLVRAGSEFGAAGEGHIRLSFAPDEERIVEGMRRLRAVIGELNSEPPVAQAETSALQAR